MRVVGGVSMTKIFVVLVFVLCLGVEASASLDWIGVVPASARPAGTGLTWPNPAWAKQRESDLSQSVGLQVKLSWVGIDVSCLNEFDRVGLELLFVV